MFYSVSIAVFRANFDNWRYLMQWSIASSQILAVSGTGGTVDVTWPAFTVRDDNKQTVIFSWSIYQHIAMIHIEARYRKCASWKCFLCSSEWSEWLIVTLVSLSLNPLWLIDNLSFFRDDVSIFADAVTKIARYFNVQFSNLYSNFPKLTVAFSSDAVRSRYAVNRWNVQRIVAELRQQLLHPTTSILPNDVCFKVVCMLCWRLMAGGADSGFNKVKPEEYTPRLFHFSGSGKNVVVTQVS